MSMESKFSSIEQYLRKLSCQEKEIHVLDHNYVKHYTAHPDSQRTKPAKLLFTKGVQRYTYFIDNSSVDEVDVVSLGEDPPGGTVSPFDCPKAKLLINECERSLNKGGLFPSFEEKPKRLEEKLCRFTPKQMRIYQEAMKIIDSERLSQLTFIGTFNESVKRRLAVERNASQLRSLYAENFWDKELLCWLHKTIINECDMPTLTCYLRITQALRIKVPTIVDSIFLGGLSHSSPSLDAVGQIIKKEWDPVLPVINQYKPKKMPGNPVILICCPIGPFYRITNSYRERVHFWQTHLSSLCKVLTVPFCYTDAKTPASVEEYLDLVITSVRTKVVELKHHYPNRPIVLLGWITGALMACHIAMQESVAAVICLGFPLTGVNGSRGDLDDPLLDSKVPTLFVVGENASMCSTDDIEDFRSRMRAETNLVVIGGSDDFLTMNETIKRLQCVTQAMVDRCIVDEIYEFLMSVFIKMPSVPMPTSFSAEKISGYIKEHPGIPQVDEGGKRKRRKPKEYSPELSPVRKRAKHQLRQISHAIPSARLSPTTSESSSSCSLTNEKLLVAKLGQEVQNEEEMKKLMEVKKTSNKKVGRPAAGTWRKRLSSKIVNDVDKDESAFKKVPRTVTEELEQLASAKTSKSESKKVPFPIKILPKKNDPVDVEKAFGRDSSFLPRPLTPPEPEDTVSAEETEKAMAELESMSNLPSSDSLAVSDLNSGTSLLNQVIPNENSFLPVSNLSDNSVLTSTMNSHSVAKPLCLPGESKTIPASVAPGFRTIFQPGKLVNANSLQSVKYVNGVSLIGNNHVIGSSHAGSTNPSKSTVITLSSANTATILVSSPNVRTQPGKIIQLLSKGNLALAAKNPSVTAVGDSVNSSISSDQQSCNLSLLSDVAGMTEPLKDSSKKIEGSTSATLVKLAVSDRAQTQPIKCLKVKKMLRAPSPPVRVETPEELVEKQLAIQALNNSIGIESPSSSFKESGYSICYAKADGSIVSQAVTRPGFSYLNRPPLISVHSRARGKSRLSFPNKSFMFTDI